MVAFPVEKTLILDGFTAATQIEEILRPWLKAAPYGFYLETQIKPIARPGQLCYRGNSALPGRYDPAPFQIRHLDDFQGLLYDEDGNLIFNEARHKNTLHDYPTMPVVGFEMLHDALNHFLQLHSGWVTGLKDARGYEKVWVEKYLVNYDKEFHDQTPDFTPLERAYDTTIQLREQIKDFIGNQTWVMYFVKQKDIDIVIEKTIDYRIWDWTRRTASGEWEK